ncbi:hypothetical protein V8E51_019479 [Hyaloscypha variabilis]
MALSSSDKIALATLILSIPGIIVTIWGAIINYQNFKHFQALSRESTMLPIHNPTPRYTFPLTTGFDTKFDNFREDKLGRQCDIQTGVF